jgi:hypothetical protein
MSCQQQNQSSELLFGKSIETVTCREILSLVRVTHESPFIEFKEGVKDKKDLREKILRNITAFLNSGDGRGLIVFGVRGEEEIEKIVCIPRGIIRGSLEDKDDVVSFVRESVFDHLKSIPNYPVPPYLSIRVFDCKTDCNIEQDGWLVITYVEKRADAIYYSDIEDSAYIREGSRSRRLRLEEILQLIESKRKPLVMLMLKQTEITDLRHLNLKVIVKNIGFKPANCFSATIKISKLIEVLTGAGQTSTEIKDVNIINILNAKKLLEDRDAVVISILHHEAQSMPIFPDILADKGLVSIALENPLPENAKIRIRFIAEVYTEETKISQQCETLLRDNDAEYTCRIFARDYLGSIIFNSALRGYI